MTALSQGLANAPDPAAALNAWLTQIGFTFPGAVRTVSLNAATEWPMLSDLVRFPWVLGAIVVAILATLTARSIKVGLVAGIFSLIALVPWGGSDGLVTLIMSLVAVAVALLIGLLLGYLHAAYPIARIITWPALWLLLTLPILGVIGIATGVIAPGGFEVQAILLLSAPIGVMARGSALILQDVDPELKRQAERIGAGHAQQVRLLSLPLAAPSLRSVAHNSVMVFFAVLLALGSLGLPGLPRDIWLALAGQDVGSLIVATIRLWLLAVSVDLIFRFMGLGRLRRLKEVL